MFDITYGKPRRIDPNKEESRNPYLLALKRKLHPKTYDRIVKTCEDAIEEIVASSPDGKLIWTKTGALVGHNSVTAHKHVEHFWESIVKAVGPDKACLKAAGSLVRLVIARRSEKWLCYRRESGHVDSDTGRDILISEYWINQDFDYRSLC